MSKFSPPWLLSAAVFEKELCHWPMREIVNGIFYVMRAGCPWRLLPNDLPPWDDLPLVRRLARRWAF
jgi:transposase